MESCGYYPSKLGIFQICSVPEGITRIKLVNAVGENHYPTALCDLAFRQLSEYLAGDRTEFDLPLSPSGTHFQHTVWEALQRIPQGETRTYGQIAAQIGNPHSARAVGMACNRNPIWIVIPCHRVLGANQTLTGYAGGLALKQTLLQLEQQ